MTLYLRVCLRVNHCILGRASVYSLATARSFPQTVMMCCFVKISVSGDSCVLKMEKYSPKKESKKYSDLDTCTYPRKSQIGVFGINKILRFNTSIDLTKDNGPELNSGFIFCTVQYGKRMR